MSFEPSGIGEQMEIPATCWLCGKHAGGIGIGDGWNRKYAKGSKDPKWLCDECLPVMQRAKEMKRADLWELHALEGGVEAVGDYLEEIGLTDLALMDDLQANTIVKLAWYGSAKRLRELLMESTGEFPPRGRN